jgi:Tfp pilus assembly protein PilN
MSQQINLYHAGLRTAQRPLTAVRLALGLVALGAVLAGYYAYAQFQVYQSEATLADASTQLKDAQDRLLKLGSGSAPASGRALEESIARAEAELKIREAVLKRLGGADLGGTQGFSAYLTALARQRVEGVWITGLSVAGDSGDFTLQGGVLRPEILLDYLRRLSREEVLKGRQIGDLRLLRKEVEVRQPQPVAAVPQAGQAAKPRGELSRRLRFVEFSVGTGASRGPGS